MTIRNEAYWHEIEEKQPFMEDCKGLPSHNKAWKYLEALQRERHLTAIDVMNLEQLIDAVFCCGVESDVRDVRCTSGSAPGTHQRPLGEEV